MALIKCEECGTEISSKADCCPKCGCKTLRSETVKEAKILMVTIIVAWIVLLIGFILLVRNFDAIRVLFKYGINETVNYWEEEFSGATWGFSLFVGAVVTLILSRKKIKELEYQANVIKMREETAERVARGPGVNPTGGWTCTCGRKNANYTSTCSCGVQKRNLK